jgi:hypothetical protein
MDDACSNHGRVWQLPHISWCLWALAIGWRRKLGSKFRKNSGRNSGSGPFSGIFGSGVAGIIFLGIAFFRTF